MNAEIFIASCFEIGIELLNKKHLTKEEKKFLRLLDNFEQHIIKEEPNSALFLL